MHSLSLFDSAHQRAPPHPFAYRRSQLQALCMAQAEALPLRQRRLGLPLASPSSSALPELLLVCTQLPTALLEPALPAALEACVQHRWKVGRGRVAEPGARRRWRPGVRCDNRYTWVAE